MSVRQQNAATLLRIVTCGSVDAGKSTLIECFLAEAGLRCSEQAARPERDLRRTDEQGFDSVPLVAHREDKMQPTGRIDAAYHFVTTARRRFVVADTPGAERYTRSMVTGASTAQVALLVVDAHTGILTQTRHHIRILKLLGVPQVVVAVNKMDLVRWHKSSFERIADECGQFLGMLGFEGVRVVPLSALDGENVGTASGKMSWYAGPTLLRLLEEIEIAQRAQSSFRMAVQWVNQPNPGFRGLCGRIAAGVVRPGDRVRVVPSGQETTVKSIVTFDGELTAARAGQSVTLVLADDPDVQQGDAVCAASEPVEAADQFEAHLVWMSDHALVAGRRYTAKIHTRYVSATVTQIKYRVDVDSGAHLATKALALNDIAVVNLNFDTLTPFEPYEKERSFGGFILIDRLTGDTVGAGMLNFALRRSANIHRQALTVDGVARASMKGQRARCLWFTGLPASGKSTIADLVDKRLHAAGYHTYVLDGDNVRHGLCRDLGFTEADRVENNRRVAEVARLMVDAGLIVIVSFISPFRAEREFARGLFGNEQFIEVFVDTPLGLCEQRDPKGLYAKARQGNLKNFTGFDSPYEPPQCPDFRIRTRECRPEDAAELLVQYIAGGQSPLPVSASAMER